MRDKCEAGGLRKTMTGTPIHRCSWICARLRVLVDAIPLEGVVVTGVFRELEASIVLWEECPGGEVGAAAATRI
jgi:hypothetical protein